MVRAQAVYEAIEEVKITGDSITLAKYAAPSALDQNEYCLFIKPEIFRSPMAPKCLEVMFDVLSTFGQKPSACRVLGWKYLSHRKIMEQHYGVIDEVSKGGSAVISEGARSNIEGILVEKSLSGAVELGAHQFLDAYPSFTPDSLAIFYDNMQNHRVAGGTHCVIVQVRGKPIVLFNGFHPEQLENYTRSGSAIAVFSVSTREPWLRLRREMTGSTNPTRAPIGSIRRILLDRREDLSLDEVSSGRNGLHVSAGPLEGMVELRRFMSEEEVVIKAEDTAFGRLLALQGLNASDANFLESNPTLVHQGHVVPAFDLTEEMDAVPAAELLAQRSSEKEKRECE